MIKITGDGVILLLSLVFGIGAILPTEREIQTIKRIVHNVRMIERNM